MSSATRYGDGWVAQVYLIRHLQGGILTDCAYTERPTDEEIAETCKLHGLQYEAERVRIVELPVVSGLEHRAEALGALDAWTPPASPTIATEIGEVGPQLDPENAAHVVGWKVKIAGTGHVTEGPTASEA